MAPQKVHCSKCNIKHTRPVGKKCSKAKSDKVGNEIGPDFDQNEVQNEQTDINNTILNELRLLSGRMTDLEAKVDSSAPSPSQSARSSRSTPLQSTEDDILLPSLNSLKDSPAIQRQIDARLKDLSTGMNQGKFKSQRGGSETVWVKAEVQWPQNHILTGSTKSRPSYDSLSIAQWVSGFAAIVKDEKNDQIKDQMLEYLSDIMDDCSDFGWQSAKAAHAVLLCKMEDQKISWGQTEKIDRIRRVHAQKPSTQMAQSKIFASRKTMPCRFYQKSSCSHKTDHETGGVSYLHLCANCYAAGKSLTHPSKDCRRNPNPKN